MRIGEGVRDVRVEVAVEARDGPVVGSPPGEEPSVFGLVLRRLGREIDRGEKVTRRVLSGGTRDLGPDALLALQAGIYRYSEAVDLSAKLIDRATSGLKTILQGQQ